VKAKRLKGQKGREAINPAVARINYLRPWAFDGDSLSYLWSQYPEAGSYREQIKLGNAENHHTVSGQAPVVTKAETAQFIVQVIDKGSPALRRYGRVIFTFMP